MAKKDYWKNIPNEQKIILELCGKNKTNYETKRNKTVSNLRCRF